MWIFVRLNTLRGTPKKYDELPRPFYMGVLPPGGGASKRSKQMYFLVVRQGVGWGENRPTHSPMS